MMNKSLLAIPLILSGLSLGLLLVPAEVHPQYRVGSFSTVQHGDEHGYRDGYEYGRDARLRSVAMDYRTDVFEAADRGYQSYMGPPADYREGYRDGYRI